MRVYRIEDNAGRGAWRAGLSYEHDALVPDREVRASSMPCPGDEPSGTPLHTHYFGRGLGDMLFAFASKSQLKRAFRYKRGRAAMDKMGGRVGVYEVPDWAVLKGKAQVVFNPAHAVLAEVLDCASLEVRP